LAGEHLAEGIRDVDYFDGGGVHAGRCERALDDLSGQGREVAALLGEVAGKVALETAEDPHSGRAAHKRTLLRRVPEKGGPVGSRAEPTGPRRTRRPADVHASFASLPRGTFNKHGQSKLFG